MENNKQARQAQLPVILISVGSGILGTTIQAPIDRVKLLLQCQNEMVLSRRLDQRYRGIIGCVRQTYKTEGFINFWRGNVAGIFQVLISNASSFAIKDMVKKTNIFKNKVGDSYGVIVSKNIIQGSVAGFLSLILVYSFDYCRNRLACDVLGGEKSATRQFGGMSDVYRKTLASDGMVGLYRGFWTAIAGICVYRGLYFGLYDTIRPMVAGRDGSTQVLNSFLLGYCVTLTAGMAAYPIDTIRRRMMMRSCEPVKYRGALDCARFIVKNEGFRPFMNGFGVQLIKSVGGAVLLMGYDMFRRRSH